MTEEQLESKIDDLYRLEPGEFTAARNALSRTLSAEAARRVKQLAKPKAAPWAINQLYWNARALYDRVMKSGQALRRAEIQAIAGKGGDVTRASDSHRNVLAEAVREARKLAAGASLSPDVDVLSTMLEALSVAPRPPEHPGRLTELVQPAGFEAFGALGVRPAAKPTEKEAARERAEAAAREQEAARQRKEAEQRVSEAEHEVERARLVEARASDALDKAQEDRRLAEAALAAARKSLRDS